MLADGLVVLVGGEVGLGDTGTDPVDSADVAWGAIGRLPRPRLKLGRGWLFLATPLVLPGLLVAVWRKGLSSFW